MADNTPASYQDLGYDRIFVSLDGSEEQAKVLDRAITIAACDNAELYVGHVIDSTALEAAGTYPVDLIPALEKEFRDSIAGQVAKAEAEPQIKKVDMLDVIKPDLVVCGARGLSSIKYAILGSISTFLTRNTECDTLIVK